MDVAVPEASRDRQAGAIDHLGLPRRAESRPAADGGDPATIDQHDRVAYRRVSRARVDRPADERELHRLGRLTGDRDAGTQGQRRDAKRDEQRIHAMVPAGTFRVGYPPDLIGASTARAVRATKRR